MYVFFYRCIIEHLFTTFYFLLYRLRPDNIVFWEQQGLQTFGQRIQITRPQASQPAFDRHFASLVDEYGAVHSINLLGTKENEALLTSAYNRHMQIARSAVGDTIGITNYDFHAAVRYGGHESVFRGIRLVIR